MLERSEAGPVDVVGLVPAEDGGAEDLARLVERAAVEVEDAEVLAEGLVPLQLVRQLPLEGTMGPIDLGVEGGRGRGDLFDVELAEVVLGQVRGPLLYRAP